MFKNIALAAVMTMGLANAQDYMIDTTDLTATISEEEAMAAVNEFAQFMNELTSALESATDLTSADAAAERINTLKLTAPGLQAKLNRIQTMDPAIQQKLLPIVLGTVVEHGQRVSVVIDNLRANDCYGSQALRECLEELQAQ